jgi:hypothetical protein
MRPTGNFMAKEARSAVRHPRRPTLAVVMVAAAAVVADLTGDGRPDLAVANAHSRDASLLLGNSGGRFRHPRQLPGALHPVISRPRGISTVTAGWTRPSRTKTPATFPSFFACISSRVLDGRF